MRSAIERLLLPSECLVCRQVIGDPDDPVVCAVCRARWRRVGPPWCARCGQPTLGRLACALCADWPSGFVAARSAVWLDEGPRSAVHALKYDGFPRLAGELGLLVARLELPEVPRAQAVLVPIPLGAKRLRRRGYNQSDALAAACAAAWGVEVRRDVLRRVRETATQTALTPARRRANVAGAFRTPPGTRVPRTVVLVDDVFTTGATLAEAARALLDAGVARVGAVTFGRAILRDFTKE